MDAVAGTTSTFPVVAEMDNTAGCLHTILMMLADLQEGERRYSRGGFEKGN